MSRPPCRQRVRIHPYVGLDVARRVKGGAGDGK
jgi:hypothetical protein